MKMVSSEDWLGRWCLIVTASAMMIILAGCASKPANGMTQTTPPTTKAQDMPLPIYVDPTMEQPLPIYERTLQEKGDDPGPETIAR